MRTAYRVALALSALSVLPVLLWSLGTPEPFRFVDLAVYQQAGRSLGDLYGFQTPNGLPFTYPPFAALLAVPLGPVPGAVAGALWAALTVAALGFLVHRVSGPLRAALVERYGVRGAVAGGALLAAALWTQPLRDTVRFGQVGVLLAALVVADLTSGRRGVLVGLATAVKLTPALFVPYLWMAGRRRDAVVATGVAAGATLVAAAVLPQATLTYWTSAIFSTGRIGDDANGGNQSVRGMAVRAGLEGWPLLAVLAVVLVPLTVVGLRRAAAATDPVAALAVVGCLSVALTPIAWIHHLVWLVPALCVLAGDLRSRVRVSLAAGAVVLLWARLPWQAEALLLADVPGRPLWLLVQSTQGLMCLAVVLWLPVHAARDRVPA